MEEYAADSKKSRRTRSLTNEQLIAQHGKIPPQALDYEEAVLGAIMVEKDALTEVIDILKAESFYKDSHQKIYGAIQGLFQRSEPIDLLTVKTALEKEGHLEIIGGPAYIAQLTSKIASAANIEEHARVIAQKYIQRELIRISSEIIKESFDETSDVFDILDSAENKLFQVAQGNIRKSHDTMASLIIAAKEQIKKAGETKDGINGIPSGFNRLDKLTSGFKGSELLIST